jgi:hypothetical protein
MSVNVRPTDKQGEVMSELSREQIEGWKTHFKSQAQTGDITVEHWHELRALCDMALRSESGRAGVIEEILTGLRSEDDSTQLRAIIASIEALKPAAGNEGTVRVPRKKLERWLEALQFEQGGEPIGSWTAESIADIKAMLSASPAEAKGGEEV